MRDFRFDLFPSFLRALFPRWDFFDRIAFHFELELQREGRTGWEKIAFQETPPPWGLFVNVRVNEALAQLSLLEHFARDVQEMEDPARIGELGSGRLLRSLIWTKAGPSSSRLKFRVIAVSPDRRMTLHVSDWISREDR